VQIEKFKNGKIKRGIKIQKPRIQPAILLKLLEKHDLQKYDICKICGVSAATAERYIKYGVPEAQYRLMQLSLGDL
jgi:transcriptional regulator with AAA-type ATPase domain